MAVIEGNRLYVANAGDSRAVLCRRNIAVPLSTDHKPASESERDRIQKAGGFISDVGGVSRYVVVLGTSPVVDMCVGMCVWGVGGYWK